MQWHVLPPPLEPLICQTPAAWYAALCERVVNPTPFKVAVTGGRLAPTPGLAFLAGYQSALRALWPGVPAGIGALCITERRSSQPKDFTCVWHNERLSGQKDFVLGGDAASWLLVAARDQERLVMLEVDGNAPGLDFIALPSLGLLPDVPHAKVQFNAVQGRCLPGDGWQDYAKPFRTLEDIYVLGAMLAWLLAQAAIYHWSEQLKSQLLRLLNSCSFLSTQACTKATTHVALAAVLEQFATLRTALDQAFESAPQTLREAWLRDQKVLDLAQGARQKRLLNAQRQLMDDLPAR